jgi:ubiquinone/menaquinone biosynthesis C-methylase UbiE
MLSRKKFLRAAAGLIGAGFAQSIPGHTQPRSDAVAQNKPEEFAERVLSDTATAMLSFGAYIGDRLGIFQAMSGTGPATVSELAARTRLRERYMQEWLALMATAGYVGYDPKSSKYNLPREHASVLCDENFPFFMGGFVELLACVLPVSKVIEGFRGGKGPLAEDYTPEHWEGIERSTVPSYRNFLTQTYLAAMPDVVGRLNAGGAALDLGCGGGIASLEIAKAYPKAEVFGFDVFAPSIERAKRNAVSAGLGDRVRFETYDGITLPVERYDLVTVCYTVHHLSDPVKTLRSVAKALRKGGSLLIMEANVPEKVEESIGHTYANWNHGVSLFYCMSEVLAEGGPGYGAAIKGSEIKALGEKAGFTRFRRLPVENPFDALYEFKAGA